MLLSDVSLGFRRPSHLPIDRSFYGIFSTCLRSREIANRKLRVQATRPHMSPLQSSSVSSSTQACASSNTPPRLSLPRSQQCEHSRTSMMFMKHGGNISRTRASRYGYRLDKLDPLSSLGLMTVDDTIVRDYCITRLDRPTKHIILKYFKSSNQMRRWTDPSRSRGRRDN